MAVTIELLMEYAESDHNIPSQVTYDALIELDVAAIEYLFENLKGKRGIFADFLRRRATETRGDKAYFALVGALNALVDVGIISTLVSLNDERVADVLRQLLHTVKHSAYITAAAEGVIDIQHNGNYQAALGDESFLVRKFAAKHLSDTNQISTLIIALSNDAPQVRQIAGWHMGRNTVFQAEDALRAQIQQETDSEAKRAMTWALGILEKYGDD